MFPGMFSQVGLQLALADEARRADFTFERFNVAVPHHVLLQVGIMRKSPATDRTQERLLATMHPRVVFQCGQHRESFATLFTRMLVRLISVRLHMVGQIFCIPELGRTIDTIQSNRNFDAISADSRFGFLGQPVMG